MNWHQLFHGFVRTPQLWRGAINGIPQLEVAKIQQPRYSNALPPSLRLGHVAEFFTLEYWSHLPDLELICHNIQIEGEHQTLGEIDAILRTETEWLHVEMAYKFYLYDSEHGTTSLEHWIGPNRKDSLTAKLQRLTDHQLPLIDTIEAKRQLQSFVPRHTPMTSKVWLKAQLFVPLGAEIDVAPLNPECVQGYYMQTDALQKLEKHSFFLPTKLEWLLEPTAATNWKSLEQITAEIEPILERRFSPLLWTKAPNGTLQKIFVVWWN